ADSAGVVTWTVAVTVDRQVSMEDPLEPKGKISGSFVVKLISPYLTYIFAIKYAFENLAGAEIENFASTDRDLFSCLGVAPHTGLFLTNFKLSEAGDLYFFPTAQGVF